MQVLFVEGKTLEGLQAWARQLRYPYRILQRPEQGLYLLEVWACPADLEAQATQLEGVRVWGFELLEDGQFLAS